jgi:hypothetical protein
MRIKLLLVICSLLIGILLFSSGIDTHLYHTSVINDEIIRYFEEKFQIEDDLVIKQYVEECFYYGVDSL